jgi:hypothetical protein
MSGRLEFRLLRPLVALLVLSLSGCAHTLYVTARHSPVTGQTVITTTPGHPSGLLTLELGGKTFTGRWVYMSAGGTVTLASATATDGMRSATATRTAFGIPTSGNGSIVLSAPDGDSLRCVFTYSEWSSSGIGECQDSRDESYDLQIVK